ncbi:hypothetical protein FRC07_014933 [Ceratobasidium sp. 392]|nr:hypothetical protein FRC07_014933 [Ceratobasidium sp. 392]
MTGTLSLVDRFQQLADSQKDLIADAEREVVVWKNAHRNCDGEIAALKKEIATLKQAKPEVSRYTPERVGFIANLDVLKPDGSNPLLLCLIDGDGCIFSEKLLALGIEGGREAAFQLRQHIIAHYGSNPDLLVHVFFNREGLGKTLQTYLKVQPGTFSAFITGFNTASPLMSMLDVGAGKEAADAKIREQMRIFVRFPHVKRIYFGGGHDNGYTNGLAALHNEGYFDKIVLLQSYTQLAAEIKALGLPCLENNGVFLTQKLSFKSVPNVQVNSGAPSPAPGIARAKSGAKTPVTAATAIPPPPPSGKIKVPTGKNYKANVTTLKTLCPYGHDYEFSPEMLADLRELVKQNPCLFVIKGRQIALRYNIGTLNVRLQVLTALGIKRSVLAHVRTAGMHGSPVSSVQGSDDDRVLLAPRFPSLHARNGSSSSNADITPISTPSPNKKAAKMRQTTPNKLVQTKLAFKNSVSGATPKERLAQMGVIRAGTVSLYSKEEDEDEESEEIFGQDYLAGSLNGNKSQYVSYNPRSQGFRVMD